MTEDNDPYEYKPMNMDYTSKGDEYGGDQCPNCGKALKYNSLVYNEGGKKGKLLEMSPNDVSVPLWCKDCWHDVAGQVKASNNHQLDEFL